MKELIPHINPIEVVKVDFKDERLAKYTQRITAIYNDAAAYADTKNREIAKILAEVVAKDALKKDGFKSVADYANKCFGIARQNAYALANAGKVYNDVKAPAELKAMTPSKLAELSGVDPKDLKKAIEDGTITHDTTQKDLRDFAAKSKSDGKAWKAEIIDLYTARPCCPALLDETAESMKTPRTFEEWDVWFSDYVGRVAPNSGAVEVVKLPNGKATLDAKKPTVLRRLYFNRAYSVVVEYHKHVAEKPTGAPSKSKFTREQLLAMLAEMGEDSPEK